MKHRENTYREVKQFDLNKEQIYNIFYITNTLLGL